MFRRGDVVFYRNQKDDVGVVDRLHEILPGEVWVNWTEGPDKGLQLHCDAAELTLITRSEDITKRSLTEYTTRELKKLLDKMDDNIVFSFSDLKIHFNKE